jgi:hypothetical protein
MIAKSYDKALSSRNLVSAFRKCGIFPLNPKALIDSIPNQTSKTIANSKDLDRSQSSSRNNQTC